MSQFKFEIQSRDSKTRARSGVVTTPHGEVQTPAFSPVATRATVRSLSPEEIWEAGAQVVLANTYHLYLRPGVEVIDSFDGFAPFMKWDGPTITDSGGYQVSFLWERGTQDLTVSSKKRVKITDEGATFRSYIDGSKHLITPESSMDIQKVLGADMIMAFDQPLKTSGSNPKKLARQNREAFERTLDWEKRSFNQWKRNEEERKKGTYQALFGIVHGGSDESMTSRSIQQMHELAFPGLAVGGQFIGSDPSVTNASLGLIMPQLPQERPVHALGLGGGVEGIIGAVEQGIDLFDNTSITRMARTGLLFIYPEDGGSTDNKHRFDIKRTVHASEHEPISQKCSCTTCQKYSRAYVHHLLKSNEMYGARLATIHNVTFILSLMKSLRESIRGGQFSENKNYWLGA